VSEGGSTRDMLDVRQALETAERGCAGT
jgi:hypothetical protein